jgi:transcriptional antiterminator RfaH
MAQAMRVLTSGERAVAEPRWYAVRTRPREEFRAEANLLAWDVETFAPRLRERRVNQFTGLPTFFHKPLFSRYIFARFEAGRLLHKVYYTRGVQSIVSFGNEPIPVEDEAISLIQSRVGEDGFVRLCDELSPGDRVVIKDGSFKGIHGVFNRHLKDSERVMIMLDSINFQAHVTVDRQLVEKARPSL